MIPLSTFEQALPDMRSMLAAFIELESPSNNKPALDAMVTAIFAALEPLGAELRFDPQTATGDHLLAHWPGPNGEHEGGVLVLCHYDTVHPIGELHTNPVREADGRLYGPGSIDMKASIVQSIFAAILMRDAGAWPRLPLTMLFTSDEEVGSPNSRDLIVREAQKASLVLCMEPALEGGLLKLWRKGGGSFKIVVHGKASHAGMYHERGVNAIVEAAHIAQTLAALTDYETGTTVSVGVIHGGTVSNVVPERCELTVDARVLTPEAAEALQAAVHGLKPHLDGARIEVSGSIRRPPMPTSPAIERAFAFAQAVASELGLPALEASGTGGGSDANWVAPLGVPLLDGMGPIGEGAHTSDECVLVDSLPPRTALLANMLLAWPEHAG